MNIELKVYLNEEKIEENLCFHAVVYSESDYDIFFDLNDTYKTLLIDALNGSLEFTYFENQTYEKNKYIIDNQGNHEEKLIKLTSFLEEFYGFTVVKEDFDLYQHVGVRLVGPGFRGNLNNPMLEQAQFNAMNSIHGLRTALFSPANNSSYVSDDIYIKRAHGSLKLTLDATKKYIQPIEFMKDIYNDIINESIDPFKFTNLDIRNKYQSIIKHLNDLNNQKNLKEFYLIIDNEEFKIENRDYLKKQSKNIYYEEIEFNGDYLGYKKGSDSFEIYIQNRGKYYCHLKELSKENYEKYQEILKILEPINIITNNVKLKIKGKRVKAQTINITDIAIIH